MKCLKFLLGLVCLWAGTPGPFLLAETAATPEVGLPPPPGEQARTFGASGPANEVSEPLSPSSPRQATEEQVLPAQSFPPAQVIKHFEFSGNKVISSAQLSRLLQNDVSQNGDFRSSAEDIESARLLVTGAYVNGGYINSGAVLKQVKGDTVFFEITEGTLTEIKPTTTPSWLSGAWIRQEIRSAVGAPLNYDRLRDELQLLRENPCIGSINASLEPGEKAGESILKLDVKEKSPLEAYLTFSNNRPPSVGAENIAVNLVDNSLLGYNDTLNLSWIPAHSAGDTLSHSWEYSGNENYGGSYTVPCPPWGTRFTIHGTHSDSAIIEQPFDILNITSRLAEYGIMIEQPVIRDLYHTLNISIGLEKDYSKTFLLGQPFDVSPGSVDGVSNVTMIPLTIDGIVFRDENQVYSLRSTLNIGLTVLGATQDNGPGPDSNFVSWVTQSLYTRKLIDAGKEVQTAPGCWFTEAMVVARLNTQISNHQLLSLEQFSIGGVESVRGYSENELLRDNGIFGSLELRLPLLTHFVPAKGERPSETENIVTLAPFFDVASGWNVAKADTSSPTGQEQTLAGMGMGLLVHPCPYVDGQLYWGYGFERNFINSGSNVQNEGIYFSLTVKTP